MILSAIKSRWAAPAGYRQVLAVAVPLVLSTGSMSVLHFVDRMFLAWYSPDALAAAMPGGILSFTFVSLFLGTASYVNTFVAQYHGAKQLENIGTAVWQAIFLALVSGVLLFFMGPILGPFIIWHAGHPPQIMSLEYVYFAILTMGGGFIVLGGALSAFYSGRGRTWPIMWINVGMVTLNIVLDWAWVFGHLGLPRAGIAGAAYATVLSNAAGCVAFLVLFLSRKNRREFATGRWTLDISLFKRLLRFGVPNGIQFMLDMLAFTFFILLIGRLGRAELTATNLAFQINLLVFLPMLGFGLATTTLVGRYLAQDKPLLAVRATWSSFHLTLAYMLTFALLYFFFPEILIEPFVRKSSPAEFAVIIPLAILLLRFVALYSIFDTMCVIFSAALRGAGDTRFVMWFSTAMAWSLMVLPTYLICRTPSDKDLLHSWLCLSVYVALLGCGFLLRFLQGKWQSMRVIETATPAIDIHPAPIGLPSGTEV